MTSSSLVLLVLVLVASYTLLVSSFSFLCLSNFLRYLYDRCAFKGLEFPDRWPVKAWQSSLHHYHIILVTSMSGIGTGGEGFTLDDQTRVAEQLQGIALAKGSRVGLGE